MAVFFRALVTVGDYQFPEPSSYSGSTSTLVDSARNAEGRMIGSVIREDVAKVEIGFNDLCVSLTAKIVFHMNYRGDILFHFGCINRHSCVNLSADKRPAVKVAAKLLVIRDRC